MRVCFGTEGQERAKRTGQSGGRTERVETACDWTASQISATLFFRTRTLAVASTPDAKTSTQILYIDSRTAAATAVRCSSTNRITRIGSCSSFAIDMTAPPSKATDAVLVASDPVPDDARQVQGIDWAAMTPDHRNVIANFVNNLSGQGFQSSSIGDAVRIVNDMVRPS